MKRPVARNRREARRNAAITTAARARNNGRHRPAGKRTRSGRVRRSSRRWLIEGALIAVTVMCFVGLLGTGGAIGVVDYFAGDMPSIDQLQSANLMQTTRILDRNGKLIAAFYHENRTVVPLSAVSAQLERATIDTEDRTFYSNSGVDYRRLVIAI
ncbi:MAG: transglycosylase domain-containing protein, partial [Acidobacteria bacterium]|nr:transglycosylase domain-containing protein [Acidobacteriota bacterium]